jgi:DNA-binding CsgD family transcriptional regulator
VQGADLTTRSGDMVGRAAELEALRSLLTRAGTGHPAVLVIEGEPGVGKSHLLRVAAEDARAAGWRVLGTAGDPTESAISYAGLLTLLHPLQPHPAALPPPQADALGAALGWRHRDVRGMEPFLVGAATMSVLATAASESTAAPILVVVDDAHWADRETLDAVLFAARRLRHDRVATVLAVRTDTPAHPALATLPRLTLTGLPAADAQSLLGPGWVPDVVDRLVERTGGNPLALVEAARQLTAAQRAGAAAMPDELPVGDRLLGALAADLAALPADGRAAVVLASATRGADAAPVLAALRAAGHDPSSALAAAEPMVRLTDGRLRLRHPLVRLAVLGALPDHERRRVHQELAAVTTDPGARVWHQAEAAVGPDDELATALASLAAAERARAGHAAASLTWERAATASSDPAVAAEWRIAAAEEAWLAGDLDRMRALATALVDHDDPQVRGQALALLGRGQQYRGSHQQAQALMVEASRLLTGQRLLRTLLDLAFVGYLLDEPAAVRDAATRAGKAAEPDDPEQQMIAAYTAGMAEVFEGHPGRGAPHMQRALALLESEPLRDETRYLDVAILAARWLLDPRAAVAFADRRLEHARSLGALSVLTTALSLVAWGRFMLGDHQQAYALAGEAVELVDTLQLPTEPGVAFELLAFECALRARHDEATRLLQRAEAVSRVAGYAEPPPHLAKAMAYVALLAGDLPRVVSLLEHELDRNGGLGMLLEPLGVAPELVEAYVGLGRIDEARDLTRRFAAAHPDATFPAMPALVARCQGLVAATPVEMDRWFHLAHERHSAWPAPLDAARTRLLHGMALRRAGLRVQARQQLRLARDAFAAMDLTLLVASADTEIAASGERRRTRDGGTGEALSPQEARVALLVAEGLTNKEVATRLFLSPRTVEHHLSAVLRKRGLTTRAQLAAAMATGRE